MVLATADSNVYVSALQFGGTPRQLLIAARARTFKLCISEPLINEIQGVLRNKFFWSEDMLEEGFTGLRGFIHFVSPSRRLSVIAEDPDDDRVLECAVASDSQFIISGDKHLLRLSQYEGIRIIKVAEFLTLIPKP